MNKEIQKLLVDLFGSIASITVIFFFFTLWLFSYNNIDDPLKDSWDISISFFSAIATLGAAIVAAKLFNHWKESQTGINRSELAKKLLSDLIELKEYCDYHFEQTRIDIFFKSDNQLESQEHLEESRKYFYAKKIEFQNEFKTISERFFINLRMYENVYNVQIIDENEIGLFYCYKTFILIMYSKLEENLSKDNLKKFHKGELKEEKEKFKNIYFNKIVTETKIYINFE